MTDDEEGRGGKCKTLNLVPQIAEPTVGIPKKEDVTEKGEWINREIDLGVEDLPAERVRHECGKSEYEGTGQPPPRRPLLRHAFPRR